MPLDRRAILTVALLAPVPVLGQTKSTAKKPPAADESDHGWFKLRSDEGKPFPNLRLPSELTSEVERLPGLIRAGSDAPDVTLVAFTDYNCPWCRKAAADLDALVRSDADFRLGLVNNPVLSAGSKEAAKVELAVIKTHGRRQAYALHMAALALKGHVDGARALDTAAARGLDRAELAEAAKTDPELTEALDRQMRLAEQLAFTVTPSFMIGGAGVIGYPGPKAIAGMIAAMRRCEMIACG